jgi:2-polyprenyl-3-methyl-5-hydroxy-6-metoxy-1,4-benzoquinol methylase
MPDTATIPLDQDQELRNWRHDAAVASKGASSQPIYRMFASAIDDLPVRGDALDYGSGTGSLARLLLSTGKFGSVSAADILDRPADLPAGINWHPADLNNRLGCLQDASMDLIVSSEVIEHLENPRAVIRDWFRILRPGGYLLFSTPNNESWRAILSLVVQGHFVLFGDKSYPAHITALVRRDMERIALEAGFRKPRFRYTHHGAIPKLPGTSWQSFTFGLFRGLRFSDNVMAVAQKPASGG